MEVSSSSKHTPMNQHEMLVNAVELASELADLELRRDWDYSLGEIDEEDEDEDETRYTEDAQDIFNDLYDKYWSIIEQTKK